LAIRHHLRRAIGHDTLDRTLSGLGGLFALGVAAFPTSRIEEGTAAEIAAAKAGIRRALPHR